MTKRRKEDFTCRPNSNSEVFTTVLESIDPDPDSCRLSILPKPKGIKLSCVDRSWKQHKAHAVSLPCRMPWPNHVVPKSHWCDWKGQRLCIESVCVLRGSCPSRFVCSPSDRCWDVFSQQNLKPKSILQISPTLPFAHCSCTWMTWKGMHYYWLLWGSAWAAALI